MDADLVSPNVRVSLPEFGHDDHIIDLGAYEIVLLPYTWCGLKPRHEVRPGSGGAALCELCAVNLAERRAQ